jgi:hypothetical protein
VPCKGTEYGAVKNFQITDLVLDKIKIQRHPLRKGGI